ncbi:MAG: hypothetical protein D6753_11405 [Planctomycetota bacterium]|nr:MAG: hypothetical protein D6753_11405 [Planctomycetota bacterium]
MPGTPLANCPPPARPCRVYFVYLFVLWILGGIAPASTLAQSELRSAPLSPAESAGQIATAPGWTAHLVAAEPLVVDPVEAAFDDAGRLWVVEMRDYPFRIAETPRGRIRVLVDENGDGRYDAARTFADHLEMPTGLALWRDGAVVTMAGELVFLRDTDGDLQSDTREQWLTGFAQDNEQLRANHPRIGPDGWWYIACGLRGGQVQLGTRYSHRLQQPIEIGKRDIRFDAVRGKIEPVTGPAQFGLTFDPFASRLFCSNRNPAVQVILEQADLADNPLAGIVPATLDVLPAGADSRVYPLVQAWTTSNLHAGQFTAACGVFTLPVPGDAPALEGTSVPLSDEILQWVFVCEPTGSLVHRQLLRRGTSHLERVPAAEAEQQEWLASRDPWFRPVNVGCAADGSVLIVDMHRAVIEHPQWVPTELKQRPDERWGDAAGRIYSIALATTMAPAGDKPDPSRPRTAPLETTSHLAAMVRDLGRRPLRGRPAVELVNLLRTDNHWMHQTVTRILIEREDRSVLESLSQTASDESVPPTGRIAAVQAAMLLTSDLAQTAASWLGPQSPDWMRTAVLARLRRLPVERWCEPPREFALQLQRSAGGSGAEQFEALLCLRHCPMGEPPQALLRTVAQSPDPWVLAAAAGAFAEHPGDLLWHWWQGLSRSAVTASLSARIVPIAEALTRQAVSRAEPVDDANVVFPWDQIARELDTSDLPEAQLGAGLAILRTAWDAGRRDASTAESPLREARSKTLQRARSVATASNGRSVPEWVRVEAIRLVAHVRDPQDVAIWKQLVEAESPPPLWQAALQAWFATEPDSCGVYLLAGLPRWTPSRQRIALEMVPRHAQTLEALVRALESGVIAPRQLGSSAIERLAARTRGPLADRLRAIVRSLSNTNRAEVVARYRSALELHGDPSAGRAVFQQYCASCHRIGEIGTQVGPDISDSRTKTPEQLLVAILDPNAAIDNAFFRYTVLTADDQVIEGLIAEETPDAVVVVQQDGRRHVIPRSEITDLRASGVSLMPEGFEAQIQLQQMADLIAFIKGWRYLQGGVPIEYELQDR